MYVKKDGSSYFLKLSTNIVKTYLRVAMFGTCMDCLNE